MYKAHVFAANDDKRLLETIQQALHSEGYLATVVRAGDKAFEEIRQANPDLVIVDIRIQHSQPSWKMIDDLRYDPATSGIPIVICVGELQSMRKREAYVQAQGLTVLRKPYTMEEMLGMVEPLLQGKLGAASSH